MLRLFIAVSLSAKQIDQVAALQNQLKHSLKGVRWVKQEGMHLTLSFIGETDPEMLDTIKEIMNRVVTPFSKFKLSISGCGVFPGPSRARVLWLGVEKGAEELTDLAEKLAAGLAEIGLKQEGRKYQPHLTIGRIRQSLEEKMIIEYFLAKNDFKTETAVVEHFELLESRLSSEGAKYRVLHRKKLSAD